MSDDVFGGPLGSTPLDPELIRGLRAGWVTSRLDLDEAEQENILMAHEWLRRLRIVDPLDEQFAFTLHKRMFGRVWSWAGTIRTVATNIGVAPSQIRPELRNLLADARYWVDNGSYSPDECAVRLHHRMVSIHPFPNGNGRHTRLLADLMVQALGERAFSWGRENLAHIGMARSRYLAALRAADKHDIAPLLAFARS